MLTTQHILIFNTYLNAFLHLSSFRSPTYIFHTIYAIMGYRKSFPKLMIIFLPLWDGAGEKGDGLFEPYCEYDLFRLATVLPDLSVDNDNLIIAGFYDENPDKFNVPKALRLFFSIWDIEGNLIPSATGWRVIISAKGFSLGHFTKLTTSLSIIRKVICYLQVRICLQYFNLFVTVQ